MTEAKPSLKRSLIGKVVSDKRAKTVTVLIERRVKHELYGKIVGKSSKYHAHDENGEYHTGDMIEIVGVPEELAREAFRLAAAKLPLRTTFVSRMIGA